MFGGGAGGGRPNTGIDLRICTRCRMAENEGGGCEVRLDDGRVTEEYEVLGTVRLYAVVGREEERKGAGSDRICMLVGRRSVLNCPLWACGSGGVGGKGGRFVGFETDRLIAMAMGKGGGPRDEKRRGMIRGPLGSWVLIGNGRKKGFGEGDTRFTE